jgi:hypothetical protein
MLEHWTGNSDHALGLLDHVLSKNIDRDQMTEGTIKKAMLLADVGREEEARELVSGLREVTSDPRMDGLMERME